MQRGNKCPRCEPITAISALIFIILPPSLDHISLSIFVPACTFPYSLELRVLQFKEQTWKYFVYLPFILSPSFVSPCVNFLCREDPLYCLRNPLRSFGISAFIYPKTWLKAYRPLRQAAGWWIMCSIHNRAAGTCQRNTQAHHLPLSVLPLLIKYICFGDWIKTHQAEKGWVWSNLIRASQHSLLSETVSRIGRWLGSSLLKQKPTGKGRKHSSSYNHNGSHSRNVGGPVYPPSQEFKGTRFP